MGPTSPEAGRTRGKRPRPARTASAPSAARPASAPSAARPVRNARRSRSKPASRRTRVASARAPAGRALAVGLLCFALWTIFDANHLYDNALSAPFGTRRTVAIEILRPLAAVANAFGISGPVNAADSALGRGGAITSSKLPSVSPPPPADRVRPPNDADIYGVAPRPHTWGKTSLDDGTGTQRVVWPPPIAQPTRAHPLVMLEIGDSIGEDLGYGLGDVFSNDPRVRVLQKAVIATGLARPDYYNWPVALEADLKKYRPGVVVVMLGANDDQSLSLANGGAVAVGTPQWDRVYRQRVQLLMDEAVAAGAHVLWVGLPPLDSPAVNSAFAIRVNSIAKAAAEATSGVTFAGSWNLLAGPKGAFVQYKKVNGILQQIRYSDGVHLAPYGWDLLASYLLGPMQQAWHVQLGARPLYKLG